MIPSQGGGSKLATGTLKCGYASRDIYYCTKNGVVEFHSTEETEVRVLVPSIIVTWGRPRIFGAITELLSAGTGVSTLSAFRVSGDFTLTVN